MNIHLPRSGSYFPLKMDILDIKCLMNIGCSEKSIENVLISLNPPQYYSATKFIQIKKDKNSFSHLKDVLNAKIIEISWKWLSNLPFFEDDLPIVS